MEESQTKQKYKILVVDDSRVMRVAVRKILGESYEVIEAENGEIGWQYLSENTDVQLIFCDLNMPVLNGHELLKRIRNSESNYLQNIPIVIITGNDDDDEIKEQVLENGASDFISKPFESVQLQARAKSYVKLKQTSEKLQEEATIDELTGLGSPRYYEKSVDEAIAQIKRHGGEFAMLQIEINNFKKIFIKYGRTNANSILSITGNKIQEIIRAEDKAARVGLATFSLFLISADLDGATKLAKRIQTEIHNTTFNFEDKKTLTISTSAGLFVPGINNNISFNSTYQTTNECLKTAIKSDHKLIEIKTEKLEVNLKNSDLSLSDAIKLINNGEFKLVKDAKDSLLVQLMPLLKHIIIDNNMLQKMVKMLQK